MSNKKPDLPMASLLVRVMPPEARKALYEDKQFCSAVGIRTSSTFPLGADIAVQAPSLLKTLGAAVDGRKSAQLTLSDGKKVRVKIGTKPGGGAVVYFGKQAFLFDDSDVLSAKRTKRTRGVKRALRSRPLLKNEDARWREIASARQLTKEEYVDLMTSLGGTPEAISSIVAKMRQITPEGLIPLESKYYSRLLAPPDTKLDMNAFIATPLRDARSDTLARNRPVGLRRIAFSNLWRPLIPFDIFGVPKVSEVSSLLDAYDPFSLLFGFELCSSQVIKTNSFESLGTKFLEMLFGDDAKLRQRCEVFSGCAVLTAVTLRRIFDDAVPVYWFRLAAFTHAGVITDALRSLSNPSGFFDWAIKGFGTNFLWETLCDRRDAPRWRSEWLSPEQIEAELFGRVINAVAILPKDKYPKSWQDIIQKFSSRQSARNQPYTSVLPGPLDDFGDVPDSPELRQVFSDMVAKLKAATKLSEVPRLTGLAYLTRPTDDIVRELTRLLDPTHSDVPSKDLLDDCAHIAACTRSGGLAQSVINQSLIAVRNSTSEKAIADLYNVIVEACAATPQLEPYRKLVGDTSLGLVLNIPQSIPTIGIRATFEVLTYRDSKLLPALSRACANLEAVQLRR